MIAHLVIMKPRPGLSPSARRTFADAFERALREIPTVRGIRVGRRIRHGAGYERTSPDADYAAIVEFDDLDGLQAYLRHPAHQDLGARFGETMQSAMVYDLEWTSLKDAVGKPVEEAR